MASSANCLSDFSSSSSVKSSASSPSTDFGLKTPENRSPGINSRSLGPRSENSQQQIPKLENTFKFQAISSNHQDDDDFCGCTSHSNSSKKYEVKEPEPERRTGSDNKSKPEVKEEVDAILARIMSSADINRGARPKNNTSLADEEPKWRDIGEFEVLRRTKCRRLYSSRGQSKDLALFYRNGKFYAMEAWCSHMGGPLFEGDIEDYKGSSHVMCPWHAYMFELTTGKSDIGLKQEVFPVKCENGHVFIEYTSPLSLYPYL